MSIPGELRQVASEMAAYAQRQIPELQAKLLEIELRKGELETQLRSVRGKPERALNFRPTLGADHQCPRCWIDHETRSALRPIPSDQPKEDLFRCEKCQYEYSVRF